METSIPSNVFPLRPLESFQVILSPTALQLSRRILGGSLKSLYWKPANLRGPERRWFLHPSVVIGKIFCISHQNMSCWPVVYAWLVCRLSLIIRRTAHGPTRHHLSGMPSTLVEWGVMRLLRSSFVEMRPESTSSSPIFGKGDARYVGLCW